MLSQDLNKQSDINSRSISQIIEKYYEEDGLKEAKNISEWLLEEGFELEKNNNKKEYFRVLAKKNNEKTKAQYIFELADYGKRISNIKILII